MLVLGIETSCDETAASVVEDGRKIRSNIIASSLAEHSKFGGVVPEIACRHHVEWIQEVVDRALREAGVGLGEIDAIAVTQGPGLIGALLVGISMAKAMAFALDKPLLGVHHLQAHLYANFLSELAPPFPYIGLIVSGGHTILVKVSDADRYQILGQTTDDAAGEAFDKVAKLIGLNYPGGPVIDQLAKGGNPKAIAFPRAMLGERNFDFSFSGLKTAVLYYLKDDERSKGKGQRSKGKGESSCFVFPLTFDLSPALLNDLCASFQEAVVDVLVKKSLRSCQEHGIRTLVVGGGVAANSRLREILSAQGGQLGIWVLFPPKGLSVDNAAMIAGLGGVLMKKGYRSDLSITAQPNWPLENHRIARVA